MIRALFLLFFTFAFLQANIVIDNEFKNTIYKTSSKVYITSNNSLEIDDIKNRSFDTYNKSNFPKTADTIWTKISLENISNENKELFFRNIRAGVDYIDVFIFKNGILKKEFLLGDLREQSTKEILSRKSIFSFTFETKSQYEIFIKYKSLGSITNQWEIYTHKEFFEVETKESLIWGVIFGIIFSIIIYNSVTFFLTRNSAFIFYILSAMSSATYLLSLNGILYKLDLGLNLYFLTILTWYSAYFFIIFLLLFVVKFFNENSDTQIYKIIKLLIYFQLFALTLLSIGFYDNRFHYTTSKVDLLALSSFFFILIISVFEFYKNKQSSFYFLIGQIVYITCFTYYTLETIGILGGHQYSWLILPIGLIIEVVCISIALSVKMKHTEKEKNDMQKHLLEQSRFSNIGRTISYIVHQLKNPISILGSQINLIEATMMFKRDDLENVLDKKLPAIKNTLSYINEINHSVSTLFLNPKGKEQFDLKEQLDTLLLLQNDYFIEYDIEIVKKYDKCLIKTFKGTLSNIIMVILENAIYELKSKANEKRIVIKSYKDADTVILIIEDTAGGIKELDKVFDMDYSNKGNSGSGLGLSLAKNLVCEKLDGDIEALNTNEGARFILKIPSLRLENR